MIEDQGSCFTKAGQTSLAFCISGRGIWYIFSMAKDVPIGVRGEAQETVEHRHTLNHHNAALPPIYSTPHMIGLMEWAAANALVPRRLVRSAACLPRDRR